MSAAPTLDAVRRSLTEDWRARRIDGRTVLTAAVDDLPLDDDDLLWVEWMGDRLDHHDMAGLLRVLELARRQGVRS